MKISITLDAADPALLARFWSAALGYFQASTPTGWSTWEDWFREHDVPKSEWNVGAAIEDPLGNGPSISMLKVAEPKTAKKGPSDCDDRSECADPQLSKASLSGWEDRSSTSSSAPRTI